MLNVVWYGRLSYKFWFLIVFMLILEVQTDREDTGRFGGFRLGIIDRRSKRPCEKSFAGVSVTEYDSVAAAEQLD